MTARRDEAHARKPAERPDDEAVLPTVSRDELDVGWGDEPGERDDDWYRRERPPHHG
ncbi:MAG TPA: hypothetical protein VGN18_16800 [Jatrophihabitans sp.]|uniref:hypothetical protein n=1 Tax=Jatrophihabitans sp. TaxID=1932789 RepID=UPI002E04C14C|nr:hypothetical protein [Jatrophihabitans sp.]